VLGILGASGSGKSMTLSAIAGVTSPDAGYIEVNGSVLYDSESRINLKARERHIGMMFQNYALFPTMSVRANIASGLGPAAGREAKKRVNALLEAFSLTGLADSYPSQLSGGQAQRVAFARMLASEPDYLLLDEPFSALDAHLKEAVYDEFASHLKETGKSAILVSHSVAEIARFCAYAIVLEDGRAVASGPTKGVFEKPAHVAVARLTGCENITPAIKEGENTLFLPLWNVRLKSAAPVPDTVSYAAVRADKLQPCPDGSGLNAFGVRLLEASTLFSETRSVYRTLGGGQIIARSSMPRNSSAHTEPASYLSVLPEDVIPLISSL